MIFTALLSSLIILGHPVLQPMQWTLFAAKAEIIDSAPHPGAIGSLYDLEIVNERVNAMIAPEASPAPPRGNSWHLWPVSGWCGDYAVTKRHELLDRGWPSSFLLIVVVGLRNGAAHAILLVHVKEEWVALDNLTPEIRHSGELVYKPISIQEPGNPQNWWSIREFPR